MTSINLLLTGAQAWAVATGPLTSGMVGIPITIECDESWNGLTKNLMCRCSPWGSTDGEYRAILNVGETATVSHEVMLPDMYLYLGLEGYSDDGKLVIPTTWASCGKIEYGANTCDDPSTDPELPVWNQLQIEMEKTKEYVLTPEQAVNIQAYAQTATQAAEEAQQAAEEAKQAVESGLYYIPVVSQPTETTLKFEFKPSLTGAPIPKPVTVELPVGSGTGGGLTTAQVNALHGMFKVCLFDDSKDVDGAISAFETAFGISGGVETPEEPDVLDTIVYTIAYELVNVSSNNSVASITEGASYSATLSAADGYTLESGTVSVTMGGVDVTADVYSNGVVSISAVTGNVEIMASAVLAEQKTPELITDGLLGYFDLRNAPASKGNSSNGYYVQATQGDARLYGWYSTGAGNEYGATPPNDFCVGTSYSLKKFGTEFTWLLKNYASAAHTMRGFNKFVTPTNLGGSLAPTYNTSSGTATATATNLGKKPAGYSDLAIVVNGNSLKCYVDAVLAAEYAGSEISDFVSWYDKAMIGGTYIDSSHSIVVTAAAYYDRALSETEIVEAIEYMKTLEVTE